MAAKTEYFGSADRRFALRIPGKLLERVLEHCTEARPQETGGILIGRYSEDQRIAEVTAISGSTSDSRHHRTALVRGVRGLGRWLRWLWDRRAEYYLGEWHFHPDSAPEPSSVDSATILQIARSENYKCPEPILLVVGGNMSAGWRFHAEVTTRSGQRVPLLRQRRPAN